jgi:hypothetical protein
MLRHDARRRGLAVTHHEQMMIIGGALACAFAFLRGALTGDTGRIDRSPDEERIDYTSSEGDGRPGVRASRAPCIALVPRRLSSILDATLFMMSASALAKRPCRARPAAPIRAPSYCPVATRLAAGA